MSQDPLAGAAGAPDQPSEEELRAYVAEMRQAHAGEIVAQVVSLLLNGAQVKLGRQDARVLLDLAASINQQAGEHLDDEFTSQVTQVVNQLRMAQVEAERELGQLQAEGKVAAEENDLGGGAAASPTKAAEPPAGSPPGTGPGDSGSRLWTPGG